ncbi:heme utilization cystosolic carrier protein HutX [Vibrio sp. ZSDE26]|uniref:Heme utilization cystosolic carrier protein HutX n=1 Tax=Vibrio amylolyticus TaxID=2847292 RepID=A0A9X1XJT5_9VIBR|nr:heme utilization cystosolic carrier protein HutX [Vibrio amylolyticus]MCK6264194.1 heme utilization cystosolic carrier protein HutX [Vibrio amylolyticus]
MFTSSSYLEVKELVAQALAQDDGVAVSTMAQQLGLTEGEVTLALPDECVVTIDGVHTESILIQLPEWGKVTTIVHSFGSIFEFKNPFPKGKTAHGYYNIMGKEGLHGHLKIDQVKHIAFVSKPFKAMESHYIGFYTHDGHCVFKVYLGRDKSRQLFPQQIEAFQVLKKEFIA